MTDGELRTMLSDCRQCGSCCRTYSRVLLQPQEVDFIRRMGGHVGVEVRLAALRERGLDEMERQAAADGQVYMVHPDGRGCVFLQKRNDRYFCRIYLYRPQACRGFRCTLADGSMQHIFTSDPIHLLGLSRFGLPLAEDRSPADPAGQGQEQRP